MTMLKGSLPAPHRPRAREPHIKTSGGERIIPPPKPGGAASRDIKGGCRQSQAVPVERPKPPPAARQVLYQLRQRQAL